VPEDVAGAPFMAVGSSAPEFFTVIRPARDRVGRGRRRHRRRAAVFNSMTIVGLTGIFAGHRDPVLRFSFCILSVLLLVSYALCVLWMTKNRKIAKATYDRPPRERRHQVRHLCRQVFNSMTIVGLTGIFAGHLDQQRLA